MNLIELQDTKEIEKDINEPEYNIITSDDEADDVLSRIIWAQNKIKENEEDVAKKKEKLELMLADYEHRKNDRLRDYLCGQTAMLHSYMLSALKNKKGTIKLFHGNVRLKEDPGKTEIEDEPALIQYIKNHGLADKCISVKETVRKTDFKKLFQKDESGLYFVDENGEIIHGVHINKKDGLQLAITPAKDVSA